VTPSQTLMDSLKQVGAEMLNDWKKEAGADGEAILQSYQN
jgi:hypothetical protein